MFSVSLVDSEQIKNTWKRENVWCT